MPHRRNIIFAGMVWAALCCCSWIQAQDLDWEWEDRISIHGFISQGYMQSTDNNFLADTSEGSYEFTEAAFTTGFLVNDRLRVGLQLFSRDLGDTDNNDIELDWALGDYRLNDMLGFRFGKIKMPLGIYNTGRDADILRNSVLLPQTVYPEGNRAFAFSYQGGSIYGNLPGNIEYEAWGGTINLDPDLPNISDFLDLLALRLPKSGADMTNDYLYGAHLRWNVPWIDGLMLAGTAIRGKIRVELFDVEINRLGIPFEPYNQPLDIQWDISGYDAYSASLEYTWNNLRIASELYGLELPVSSPTLEPLEPILGTTFRSERRNNGWYAQATYRFNDWFQAGVYKGRIYPDGNDKTGDRQRLPWKFVAWHREWAYSLRFDVSGSWILKLEYHDVDGAALLNLRDIDTAPVRNWELFAFKASYSF